MTSTPITVINEVSDSRGTHTAGRESQNTVVCFGKERVKSTVCNQSINRGQLSCKAESRRREREREREREKSTRERKQKRESEEGGRQRKRMEGEREREGGREGGRQRKRMVRVRERGREEKQSQTASVRL